ncbi:MAG: hypothetical protein DRJ05_06605 [Bacteroidetes bacterium]|nr:MAG: hypothetical protein DRJ05_06605 [Bacteroidota bacterium]
MCVGKNQIGLKCGGFALLPTVGAKNSAGFGTLLFLLTLIFIAWFIVHFTSLPALFLACVVKRF